MPTRNSKKSVADASPQGAAGRNYIIQLSDRGRSFTMQEAQSLLAPTGVVLDSSYGPINVNPSAGNFVLRGRASDQARIEAESSIPGITFFGDATIGPVVGSISPPRYAAKR